MAIPDYQTLMLPLLRLAAHGGESKYRSAVENLAQEFELTDGERSELLPSGTAPLFDNRVGWAMTYLKQAGLLSSSKRGWFQITERGLALLARGPERIDIQILGQYPEFREFRNRRREGINQASAVSAVHGDYDPIDRHQTPEDQLATAYQRLRQELEIELLGQIKASSFVFFERLVIDLLLAMGYGGSRQDAGRAVGKSGDGGVDGIIKEDKLGLDVIYVQAKRWDSTVGRPEIQKFAGALEGHRASKGVFITTSSYSREAVEYVNMISKKVILIDGQELSRLMVDHNVGVSPIGMYELKKIDADYFEGE
jgi:restriction system protein